MRSVDFNVVRLVVPLGAVLLAACGGSSSTPTDTDASSSTAPDTDPSDTDPSATDPSATDPSATDPSATDPSATDPSATDPSDTDPDSSSTDPSDTDPDSSSTAPSDSSSSDDGTESSSSTDPTDDDSSGGGALPDISGDHLFALATVIDPSHPLQYIATVVQTPDGDGALLDLSLQPLSLDPGSTTTPREPVGEPITFEDVEVDADGTFVIDVGVLFVEGETNPLTGSDATAEGVVFSGTLVDDISWCGTATGMLTMPIDLDLGGTTFAATAIDGDLPVVFATSC